MFRSWRVFVLLCGAPSLVVALALHFFFPETPKFLLVRGHHDEALTVLRRLFVSNTGRDVAEYNVSVTEVV